MARRDWIILALIAWGVIGLSLLLFGDWGARAAPEAKKLWPGEIECLEYCEEYGGPDRIDWEVPAHVREPGGALCTCKDGSIKWVTHGPAAP